MRFLADMGISPVTVDWLRRLGHDALHLREQGLERLPDEVVIEKALVEGRVVLTSDLDFGYLMALSGAALPSVVLFRLSDMRPSNVAAHLEVVLRRFPSELCAGSIVVVRESAIRLRRLPIGEGIE